MSPRKIIEQLLDYLGAAQTRHRGLIEGDPEGWERACIEEFFTRVKWECAMCSHEWEVYIPIGLEEEMKEFVDCPSCDFRMGYEISTE
jgi:DNA-directed RNA polymerase subunit RPC12/RpoP